MPRPASVAPKTPAMAASQATCEPVILTDSLKGAEGGQGGGRGVGYRQVMAAGGVLGEAASMRTHGKRNGRALSERNRRLSSRANTAADAADAVAVACVAPPTHPREPPLTPEATPLCVS